MKVVQVINSLIGGGAERVTFALAKAFAKLGHESLILVFEKGGAFSKTEDGVRVIEVEKENAVSVVQNLQADLVLLHMKTPHKVFAEIYDENIFFVIHNTQSMRLRKYFYSKYFLYTDRKKRLCKLYDNHRIVTVSQGVQKDLIKEIGVKAKSVRTIYNPFDIVEIQRESEYPLSIPFEKPYIINVAGLRRAKRQDILLKSFARLKSEHHLVILGEGKLRPSLEKLAKRLDISDKVHFLGWQDNPYVWIKNADLFVLSSQFEGFGNVLVESLIVHTLPVSTNCLSGPDEILTGRLSAFLAKVNDVEDLTLKIKSALSSQEKILPHYYEHFSDIQIAKDYLSLIDE